MRREFSKQVKRDAFARANGFCEGEGCGAKLQVSRFHYDHDIPDALGGEPELWNCKVLCVACHSVKTGKQDIPRIAKTKRISDREKGIKRRSSFQTSRDGKYKQKIGGGFVLRTGNSTSGDRYDRSTDGT